MIGVVKLFYGQLGCILRIIITYLCRVNPFNVETLYEQHGMNCNIPAILSVFHSSIRSRRVILIARLLERFTFLWDYR